MAIPFAENWIRANASGKTFVDIGGLWGTVNEMVTVAAQSGAVDPTMADITPEEGELWRKFDERCREKQVGPVRKIVANVDDPALPERIGSYDIVHNSGVIYHTPDCFRTIRNLNRVCREHLVLSFVHLPETIDTAAGTLVSPPGTALLIPALLPQQRLILSDYLNEVGAQALGINALEEIHWPTAGYGLWWWLPTIQCVKGMLLAAGFEVLGEELTWYGRVCTLVTRKVFSLPALDSFTP